jgi:AhpD family alkylhydroperoxidase
MDEKIKELIAIGASISGHCQPCLTYHVDQAKRLGIGEDEIKEAMAVGKMVQKGAMAAMNKFAQTVLDNPDNSVVESQQKGESGSKTLKVYDPAMCCATGVCGPNVDKALVEFAGAVKTVAAHGVSVDRWSLAQQPHAFTENLQVKHLLAKLGVKGLPFIFVNDELQWTGRYPTAEELFFWFGINKEGQSEETLAKTNSANRPFQMLERDQEKQSADACCSDGGCCS